MLGLKTAGGETIDIFEAECDGSQKSDYGAAALDTGDDSPVQSQKRTVDAVVTLRKIDSEHDAEWDLSKALGEIIESDPYPVTTEALDLLVKLHSRGGNCVPWSYVAICPDLVTSAAFQAPAEHQGPKTFRAIADLVQEHIQLTSVWQALHR